MISDQKNMWNKIHASGEHESFRDSPSAFAEALCKNLKKNAKILDLGCGVGRDAYFFDRSNHIVTATDFSEAVIEQNRSYFSGSRIDFKVLDMHEQLPFSSEFFDLVYAYLSIHYFDDETTRNIIKDIHRVLKPRGIFAFSCKTVEDQKYGKGTEIEKNIFVAKDGHIRHFFTPEYAKDILEGLFEVERLEIIKENYSSQDSSVLLCIAKKL